MLWSANFLNKHKSSLVLLRSQALRLLLKSRQTKNSRQIFLIAPHPRLKKNPENQKILRLIPSLGDLKYGQCRMSISDLRRKDTAASRLSKKSFATSSLVVGRFAAKKGSLRSARGRLVRGGSRIFFRTGCTRLFLYFNTNKPHGFLFLQNTSCIRKPQVISGGGGRGGRVRTPCTLSLDPPLLVASLCFFLIFLLFLFS